MKASANYNMTFNEGSFIKNQPYDYEYKDESREDVLVTTEEGKVQEFPYSEFDVLFSLLTI